MIKLLPLLMVACTFKQANHVLMTTSAVAITCDYGQTMWQAGRGWKPNQEDNPLLGKRPDRIEVTAYFAATTLILGTVSMLVPEKLRPGFYGLITLQQTITVWNASLFGPWCGL